MFGLSSENIDKLNSCFAKFEKIEQVILYGSRALGTYKNGSDIDMTIVGLHFSFSDLLNLENELDDLLLPYKIDLSIKSMLSDESLLKHIDKHGTVLYEREA